MLDEVYAAVDVIKAHPTRLDAFAAPQTGPLAALVEDRVVPLGLPVRDVVEAARRKLGKAVGAAQPVALLWMGARRARPSDRGRCCAHPIDWAIAASCRRRWAAATSPSVSPILAGRLAAAIPTVIASRAGGGPMLRQTYGGPTSEIALRRPGLIWAAACIRLKARVLLETCLRAALGRDTIAEVFDAFG